MDMGFTHFDENGKAVMVDVTEKDNTVREASAEGKILVSRDVFQAVRSGSIEKGDVLAWRRRRGSWEQSVPGK